MPESERSWSGSESAPARAPLLDPPLRVFVSSTWEDLRSEREHVKDVIEGFPDLAFVGMEHFGARDGTPLDESLREAECDVYIGIVGLRFGSGITVAEYRRARAHGATCLFYLQAAGPEDERAARERDPDAYPALAQFRAELRRSHVVEEYRSAYELAAHVARDLCRVVLEAHAASRPRSAGPADGARGVEEALRQAEGTLALVAGAANSGLEDFVREYLGPPGLPRAFAGRHVEMDTLDHWLADDGAPSYLALTGPAGRGKSALLVHWIQRVLATGTVRAVFVPVSVRHGTSSALPALALLASRLAAVHGDPVPPGALFPDALRAMISSYLRLPLADGRRLLVVIDGMDEAAGWSLSGDLFPVGGRPDLRVVLSARPQPDDLGAAGPVFPPTWSAPGASVRMDLGPLETDALRALVCDAGLATSGETAAEAFAIELARITQGDPLLASLYVEDLKEGCARGESPAPGDLAGAAPGLDAYLRRWRLEQEQLWADRADGVDPVTRDSLLALFSCAMGPLRRTDLFALLPPQMELGGLQVERAVRSLSRLVTGNGEGQGYVFSHPRLADYYRTLLSPPELARWEARFVEWGEQTVAALGTGRLRPQDVPAYLLRYYGTHLECADAPATILASLVSAEWRRAWEVLEPGGAGFLEGVDRCWRAAEQADAWAVERGEPARLLPLEVRCALARASVLDSAKALPTSLVLELVRTGIWSPARARSVAQTIPDAFARAELLIDLLATCSVAERVWVEEALDAVWEVASLAHRASLFLRLAGSAATHGLPDLRAECARGAEADLQTMPQASAWDRAWRAEALALLAGHVEPERQAELRAEALAVALALNDDERRVDALLRVAEQLPDPLRTLAEQEALDATARLDDAFVRTYTLPSLLRVLRGERRDQALREGLAWARAVEHPTQRTKALIQLLPALSEGDRSAVVRELVGLTECVSDNFTRVAAQLGTAPYIGQPERDRLLSALLASPAEHFLSVDPGVATSFGQLLTLGHDEEVVRLALKASGSLAFSAIVETVARQGSARARAAFVEPALAVSVQTPASERIGLLRALAPLVAPEPYARMLSKTVSELQAPIDEQGDTIDPADVFDRAVTVDSPQAAEPPYYEAWPSVLFHGAVTLAFRALVSHIDRSDGQLGDQLDAVTELEGEEWERAIEEVLAAIRREIDPGTRARLLLKAMSQLRHPLLQQTFDECLASTREVQSPAERAELLARLSAAVRPEDRAVILNEVHELLPRVRYGLLGEELLMPAVTRLAAYGMGRWALDTIGQVQNPFEKGTLVALLLYFTRSSDDQSLVPTALGYLRDAIESVDTPERRVWLLLFAAVSLPDAQREEMIGEIEQTIRDVEAPGLRSAMFLALAPCASGERRFHLLSEALAGFDAWNSNLHCEDPLASPEAYLRTTHLPLTPMAVASRVIVMLVERTYFGPALLANFTAAELLLEVHRWERLPALRTERSQLHSDWRTILGTLVELGRTHLLAGLPRCADIAIILGGEGAAAGIAQVIREAGS
jgi:hypothetical protein